MNGQIVGDGERRIRVVIADDHPVFRGGLRALLEAAAGVDVVGEAESGPEALKICLEQSPDVALVDLSMPGMSGVEVIRAVRARRPAIRCVVLSAAAREEDVFQAVQAGARGYVLKDELGDTIKDAIRRVHAGDRVFAEGLLEMVADRTAADALTDRETVVLRLMAAGCSNEEIAERLSIVKGTVKLHARHIYRKLGCSDRAGAVMTVVRRGLVG